MRGNRAMPQAHVVPELVYPDVDAAVEWLCRVFGFAERWTASGHRAQLAVGDGAVVVTTGDEPGRAPPGDGPRSHALLVRVGDVEAHHARASEEGATILGPPADFPYGERQYTAVDLAGHRWTFSESIADVSPEDWGVHIGPAL
jgi:uncharacterized glyoxalase superfamily protein PhnB